MEIEKKIRSSIVPGRRMITHVAACYEAGMMENMSYLMEKTIANDSSLDETQDLEERGWKRQGLSDIEIFKRLENRKLKILQNAEDRLKKEKYGAKDFDELLERPEYSECESFEQNDENMQKNNIFAIPSLQKHSNEIEKRIRSSIVPGRRMITHVAACYEAEMMENMSYLMEKTIANDSSLDETQDLEERGWKRQGLSDIEIFKRLENRKLKKLQNAEDRLKKEKYGAKDFDELLERPEYSECESFEKNDENVQNNYVFAIPSLPKHLSEKSMMGSPAVGARGSGKAGLSCSTPKNGHNVSMGSLRGLNISHVCSIDRLDVNKVTIHNKNMLIPIIENDDYSCQKTHIIQKDHSSDLQGTFIVARDEEADNQKTNDVRKDTEESSLQDTFVVAEDKNDDKRNSSLQRKSKKVNLQERERRYANISMSLSNITIGDMSSPGSYRFKQIPKKSKPTIKTPPRTKMMNRLSIESDKEKTIEMLSIVEEASMEADSNSPSFVDPLSVNGSCVSPVPEFDELMDVSKAVTPKSSRRICNTSIREKFMEMEGACSPAVTPTIMNVESNNTLSVTTSKHHYQKRTISSLVKSKNTIDINDLLEASRRDRRHTPSRTANRTPNIHRTQTVKNATGSPKDEQEEEEEAALKDETLNKRNDEKMNKMNDESISNASSNRSLNNIEFELDAMTVSVQRYSDDFVYDKPQSFSDDRSIDEDTDSEENVSNLRSRQKSTKRRVELLSNSMSSTPGIDCRSTRRQGNSNETVTEDTWYPDVDYEVPQRKNKNRKNKVTVGLQLKKREIIKPERTSSNVRRSGRNRVKPVRNWLGERPVYEFSPSGGERLIGVTDVIVTNKRFCKYRTADPKLANQREQKERAIKRERLPPEDDRIWRSITEEDAVSNDS